MEHVRVFRHKTSGETVIYTAPHAVIDILTTSPSWEEITVAADKAAEPVKAEDPKPTAAKKGGAK